MASDILVTFDANLGGNALAKLEEIRAQLEALVKGTHEIKVNVNGQDVIKQLNNIASGKTGGKISGGKNGIASGITKTISADLKTQKSQIEGMISSLQKSYEKILSNPLKNSSANQKLIESYNRQIANLQRALNVVNGGREIGPTTMQGYQKDVLAYSSSIKSAYAEEEAAAKSVAAAEKKAAKEAAAIKKEKEAAAKRAAVAEKEAAKTTERATTAEEKRAAAYNKAANKRAEEQSYRSQFSSQEKSTWKDYEQEKKAIDDLKKADVDRRTKERNARAKERAAERKAYSQYEKSIDQELRSEQAQIDKYEKSYLARRNAASKAAAEAEKNYNKNWSDAEKARQKDINSQINAAQKSIDSFNRKYQQLRSGSYGNTKEVSDFGKQIANVQKLTNSAKDIQLYDPNATTKLNELSTAVSSLGNNYEKVKAKAKAFSNEQKAALRESSVFERQSTSMQNKMQAFLDKNKRLAGTSYEGQIKSLMGEMDQKASSKSGRLTDLKQYEQQFKNIKSAAADAGKAGDTLGKTVVGAVKQFGGWMLVTHSIMSVINSIKGMISNVRDLDLQMTELKKVTNETDTAYEQFFDRAKTRSKEVGATLTDTIRASADMARLGLSIPEAEQMADAAMVYKNVGDGIESIDEASQSVISTVKAFGMETSDAMSVVDKFNETGNNFAISSAGVGEAMTRSASAMAAAGNTVDETIALIAAGNEVVQDPQKMGEKLRPAA